MSARAGNDKRLVVAPALERTGRSALASSCGETAPKAQPLGSGWPDDVVARNPLCRKGFRP